MKTLLTATCLVAAALQLPIASHAEDANPTAAKTYVKDSAITTKIKTKLAAHKLSSLVKIGVDTTDKGVVVLTGYAENQAAVDKAVSIARGVKGVTSVENHIAIKPDK